MVNTINEFQERNKQLLEENENLKKQLTDKDRVLNKENEIMSKILIDIILHNDNVSDEKITELLNQEDWKERVGFSIKDSGEIGWRRVHWWVSEPQKVFRKKRALALKSEELSKQNQEYEEKIQELEAEQENLEAEVEQLEERVKIEQEQVKEVLAVGEKWSKTQAEDIKEKNKKLESSSEKVAYLEALVKELKESSSQKDKKIKQLSERLTESESQNKNLKNLFHLDNKPLPDLPIERKTKQSKFKQLKTKAKIKVQQIQKLIKKEKSYNQEMIAQVEVQPK